MYIFITTISFVRISKNKILNNFSYALVDTSMSSFNGATTEDKDNSIVLSTKMIIVEIKKQPFLKITFRDKNGNIINEDGEGDATSFTGDKVTVYKKLQENEHFVGMG